LDVAAFGVERELKHLRETRTTGRLCVLADVRDLLRFKLVLSHLVRLPLKQRQCPSRVDTDISASRNSGPPRRPAPAQSMMW